ncbi:hypothetical protein [Legionella sainthelensi]|uniref:hypothetical protein n=1 Tax=Legionella sainthelensi TaxID=28087 RepID=UPI000E1FC27A|nr:hypothetical protein [Legionella sainthelensi]
MILKFFSKKEDSSNLSNKKKGDKTSSEQNKFTNQTRMLEQYGYEDEPGMCVPLTNLYAKSRIENMPATFLQSNEDAYQQATKELEHEIELLHQGKDGYYSAYVDKGVHYTQKELSKNDLISPAGLKKTFNESQDALIIYPTAGDRHMVYRGRNVDKRNCVFFDANQPGGELVGPCEKIDKYIAEAILDNYSDEGEPPSAAIRY